MANLLLLDDSDVAGRAMRGIVGRANHRCLVARTGADAWRLLREAVIIDLVFVELRVGGDHGLEFIEQLRQDPFWKELPAVVYTTDTEARHVRNALALRVQNYLVKPYNDEAIYAEVAKARVSPWPNRYFEDPNPFCARTGITSDTLHKLRRHAMKTFDETVKSLPPAIDARAKNDVCAKLDTLVADAEAAGMSVALDYVRGLRAEAEAENWPAFKDATEPLDYAARLIFCQLNPSYVPDVLKPQADPEESRQVAERARWAQANVEAAGPVLNEAAMLKEIAGLAGCPAIHSAAAAFVMAADGHASSLTRVMELVREDPGLCAQVLIAANRLDHDDLTAIEDPNAAVTLLGEIRLNTLAKATQTIEEKYLSAPPLTWANYWMYLVGVARLSRFICEYLEFHYLAPNAYTAGLLHDLGKLLLLRLHPPAFGVIAAYARERRMLLHQAEQKFIGCTTRALAVAFAEQQKLPAVYVNVLRWVDEPETAAENVELVAMVALARHVCLHNRVGHCGDTPGDSCPPIVNTKAWQVLQPRLFPSFDLRKFEAQAHAFCRDMRLALLGQHSPVVGRTGFGAEAGREVVAAH